MRIEMWVETFEELKEVLKDRTGYWKMYGGYNTRHQCAYIHLESQDGKTEITIFLPA